jgi:SH3-like domain-containing protein
MTVRTLRHAILALVAVAALGNAPIAALAQTKPDAAPVATPPPPVKKTYDPHIGTSTKLPLPRFVSLRADQVNLRVGPGDQYPIQWLYQRTGLPVEVLREYDVWRLVVDSDGTKGWVHEATLVGTRHFVINATGPVMIMHSPADGAAPSAQLMPGVVGLIEHCDATSDWCRVRVAHAAGWLKRSEFWGAFPHEQIP